MTMAISLPPEEEKKLAERAASTGQAVEQYVQQLIRKDIELPSFADLFAPVHEAVKHSGIREEQLHSLLQSAIDDSRAN